MRTSTIVSAAETSTNPFLPADYDIIWSAVPFAVIVAFFLFWVMPRFRKILDERSALIEGGIAKAETAQAEAKAALDEYNALLSDARAEAASIREQAREDGAAILAEVRESASAEADRITKSAIAQIEAERQAAVISLRAEIGSLAIDLASGVIGQSLSDDKKASALVDQFLADLDSADAVSTGKAKS